MKRRSFGEQNEILACLLWGLGSGLAATAAGVILAAFVMTQQDVPATAAVPIGTACLALGAAVAGFVAARRKRSQGLLTGGLVGVALWTLVTFVSMFVGGLAFTIATPVRLALSVTLGALAGVLGVNLAAKRKLR